MPLNRNVSCTRHMSRPIADVWTFATLVYIVACGVETSDTYAIEEGPVWSFTAFMEKIDRFPYEMPAERKRQVLGGYTSLEVGMSKERALEILGPPDAESFTYNESQGGQLVESGWSYYLTRAERELAHPSDQAVFLHFTPDGALYWATGTNVASLQTIGSPSGDDS